MNTKSIIEIFRGDDSDALGYQTIVGTIHTDLDLTGCKAVFRYLGFFQEFDPIPEDGKLTIVIPSASSMQFPPGFGYASLKVYDIDRKVRTFTNRIPVFVKTMTTCRGGGEFDVEFSPFPELEPLKIFKGPNADDFDLYTGFISKIIDRASAQKYGLSMLFDAMDAEKTAEGGSAASPAAVKAAYDAIIKELTDNYYTAEQTDEAIDKLAAYYITSDTQGNPFATHAALMNATTYYSGGSVRTPTRNDYAIVVADETHDNEEWRYIYSENDQGVGQWEPQYAVEGVITFDDNVTRTSGNGVKSSGIWSMIWGALTALPSGVSSIYDWCVAQIAKLRDKLDLNVYSRGNALVTFPDGFSVTYMDDTYVASSGGETIEFYGPITSTAVPQYNFWVPYEYKDATDFDPQAQAVWCLFGSIGNSTPNSLMFRTGASYSIANWNTESPTLTLSNGEESGGHPTMARPLGATGDTLAKVSQMNTALALKANDDAVVKLTGNQDIGGNKTFYGDMEIADGKDLNVLGGRVAVRSQGGSDVALFEYDRLEYSTDGGMTWTSIMLDNIAPLASPAFTGTPTAPTPSDGDDSTKVATTAFVQGAVPYTLPETMTTISSASSEVISGETVYYGEATLADRKQNQVLVLVALDELRVTIPPAVSGKVRDFGLLVGVGLGEGTALAAPALVPVAPTGETITMLNAEGEMPTLADGTTTASGLTVLYFTEIGQGAFLVKGEEVKAITQ